MSMILQAFIFLALLLKISFGSHPSDVCGAAAASQCGSCQQLPVTTFPSTFLPGFTNGILTQTLSRNSAGCVVITVTCTAPPTATLSLALYMTRSLFFGGDGTPGSTEIIGLTCDDYGNLLATNVAGGNVLQVATGLGCLYQ